MPWSLKNSKKSLLTLRRGAKTLDGALIMAFQRLKKDLAGFWKQESLESLKKRIVKQRWEIEAYLVLFPACRQKLEKLKFDLDDHSREHDCLVHALTFHKSLYSPSLSGLAEILTSNQMLEIEESKKADDLAREARLAAIGSLFKWSCFFLVVGVAVAFSNCS